MHTIREIRHIDQGPLLLDLPQSFWGQTIEIIILTLSEERPRQKTSMYGCLHHYANPALIPQEENAWGNAIQEEYESC